MGPNEARLLYTAYVTAGREETAQFRWCESAAASGEQED